MTTPARGSAAAEQVSFRPLIPLEARRHLRRASIWIGFAISATMMMLVVFVWEDTWSGDLAGQVPLAITPLAFGTFIAGVLSGGRDRSTALPGLAEEAALDDGERALARLGALTVPVVLGVVLAIAAAIASRIEGGFVIGDAPWRTDSAMLGPLELLQLPLVVALGGAIGLAAGRSTRRAAPAVIIGAIATVLATSGWWALNMPGLHAFTWLQIQPIEIDLPAPIDPASFPAGWFVNTPSEYDGWRRQMVHLPTVASHNVYLLGLIVLAAGVAVRQQRGRRLAILAGRSQPWAQSRNSSPRRSNLDVTIMPTPPSAQSSERIGSTSDRRRDFVAWFAPTWRSTQWLPMATVGLVLAVIGGITRLRGTTAPDSLLVAACGAFVATAVLALDDSAHTLVHATPTSARIRLLHRVAVTAPIAMCGLALVVGAQRLLFEPPSSAPPSALAVASLLSTGIATKALVNRRRPELAAETGAGVALGWALIGLALAPQIAPTSITMAWRDHPWPVLLATLVATFLATGSQAT